MFTKYFDEKQFPKSSSTYVWKDFKVKYGMTTRKRTADILAIDDYKNLESSLKKNGYNIFRLGTHLGNKAHFSIVKMSSQKEQYLFHDEIIKTDKKIFIPDVPARELFSYTLIPNATERGLVNVALASGILKDALGLQSEPTLPIQGNSTYSFDVYPTSEQENLSYSHVNGQVEIDSCFLGKRNGREEIFVLEAKMLQGRKSLSKTKLAYAKLAVESVSKIKLPINLVYLLINKSESNAIEFYVCAIKWNSKYISELSIDKVSAYVLPTNIGI